MAGNKPYSLNLSISIYGRCLIGTALILVIVHLVLNFITYEVEEVPWLILQLFELDEENNLPTWFSSFLLLNNAILLATLAANSQSFKAQWWVLAAGFFLLCIDEVAGLHESLNTVLDIHWAIPALILVGLVGLCFIPFMLSLDRRLMVMYCLSGSLFISGALGVEFLSQDMDEDSWAYGMATAVEEGMEMLGVIIFLIVNLNFLSRQKILINLKP